MDLKPLLRLLAHGARAVLSALKFSAWFYLLDFSADLVRSCSSNSTGILPGGAIKQTSSVAGAFLSNSSRILPSVTTSARKGKYWSSCTKYIGSTPVVSMLKILLANSMESSKVARASLWKKRRKRRNFVSSDNSEGVLSHQFEAFREQNDSSRPKAKRLDPSKSKSRKSY